jgi:predicted TIM-barrel fold metal-dependent hydrolase
MPVDYPLIDADSHYYEPYDAWTRHIDPAFKDKAVHRVEGADGIGRVYQGDRRLRFAPSWMLDYTAAPGALIPYFKGEVERTSMIEEPIDPKNFPAFFSRSERLALMNEQSVQAAVTLPTQAVQVEHDMRHDPEALYANVRSFNRWIAEDWGWAHEDRIFSAAVLSLVDPDMAAAEVQRVIEDGAKLVYLAPGAAYGRSPADHVFDPFWRILNDTKVPVAFHIGDCIARLAEFYSRAWGENPEPALHRFSAFQQFTCYGDRAVMDTLAALILHNFFGRFPDLKILSIELGSEWVPSFLKHVDKAYRDAYGRPNPWGDLAEKPSDYFRKHVWISPYFEDDVPALVKDLGADHVLFGSDFPHPEGVAEPIQWADTLRGLSDDQIRKVMRGNLAGLLGLAV